MKKQRVFYSVLLVAVLVFGLNAAADLWQKIPLEGSGKISIPKSWNVKASSDSVLENAYGQGVSRRILLEADGPASSSLIVMKFWPAKGITLDDFAQDLAASLRVQNGVSSLSRAGDMFFGSIKATSMTYRVSPERDQKLTAFAQGGSLYCFILSYKSSDERSMLALTRHIIRRWEF